MRRLLPDPMDLELDEVYADLHLAPPRTARERPTVTLGMVASADGAVAVDGTSGRLGGEADRRAFLRSRDAADAIVVGAGTVRAEDYGPPRAPRSRVAARAARGAAPAPQLLVITGRVDLDPRARLFTATRDEGVPPPIVVTHAAAPGDRVRELSRVAEVVVIGEDEVDLAGVLAWCGARGLDRVLSEGGPHLNGALLEAGLVDELLLTLAPTLLGGGAARIVVGREPAPTDLELTEVHEHEGELLLRYRVTPGRPADGNRPERC